MKNIFSMALLCASVFVLQSCSNDDNQVNDLTGNGELSLHFDHSLAGDQLILNTTSHTNSLGETLKISRFSYIVSNIQLHNVDGTIFRYPVQNGYFIVNSELQNIDIDLENIPAGDYDKITFGIGVDQEKYLTGQTEQQAFWDLAQTQFMTWSWITGYKFINYEGTFTSANTTGEINFQIHMGSHGTALDNYREQTVSFPSVARVRSHTAPNVHFVVDANQILDGLHKLKLQEALNPAGTTAIIMVNAEKAPKVAENASKMFTVDHIHQGSGHSH